MSEQSDKDCEHFRRHPHETSNSHKSGLSEKKDVMVWINDNVPHDVSTYVRALYLGKDVDYLKGVKVEDILSNTCTDDALM